MKFAFVWDCVELGLLLYGIVLNEVCFCMGLC
jgi:hypothetical protein